MRAFIIKKIPIREYDELVICYTQEDGKQVYKAKSVLRSTSKQASHLDILNLVDFNLVQGNGHPIITSAYCLNAFSKIKSDIKALAVSFFIVELMDKVVMEGERDGSLWDFLSNKLNDINLFANKKDIFWQKEFKKIHAEAVNVLGYGKGLSIEEAVERRFGSLQLIQNVVR